MSQTQFSKGQEIYGTNLTPGHENQKGRVISIANDQCEVEWQNGQKESYPFDSLVLTPMSEEALSSQQRS